MKELLYVLSKGTSRLFLNTLYVSFDKRQGKAGWDGALWTPAVRRNVASVFVFASLFAEICEPIRANPHFSQRIVRWELFSLTPPWRIELTFERHWGMQTLDNHFSESMVFGINALDSLRQTKLTR
jgi:hypothetical protein